MKLISLLCAAACVTLAGCVVRPPSPPGIKVIAPVVVIGPEGKAHCPPGQAKKGNC
jgi:hypothetical protein